MDRFSFSEYINSRTKPSEEAARPADLSGFYELCKTVKAAFYREWDSSDNTKAALEIQKRAIVGYEKEKEFYKGRIKDLITEYGAFSSGFPAWYPDIAEAVYQENWGFAGLAEWFAPRYSQSSSAKIVADRIYFMDGGKMKMMPQRIDRSRLDQLIRAFLLLTPAERMDKSYYELYLLDGTRVTIYTEPMAKNGQAAVVLRRYLIPELSFEGQAERGTIPAASVPLFKSMVRIGFNVVFLGAVRTAKTTFLSTWQSLEDPSLEGVMVETDPEIPMHKILPNAPILQLIADGDDLRGISKSLLRSDADYFILAEARDGIALDTAVRLASKGTKRMKMTFHTRRPDRFPLEAATEIVKATGGDLSLTMQMVAGSFDYLFHFIQPGDKSQKRLGGIYQMGCTSDGRIEIERICKYDEADGSWEFRNVVGQLQAQYAMENAPEAYRQMRSQLAVLSEHPVR